MELSNSVLGTRGGSMRYTDNDIVSPDVYADEMKLHAMFAAMRRQEPVRWTTPDDYRPFWAITKYADIAEIERRTDIFRAGPRNRLLTVQEEELAKGMGGGRLIQSLPSMDDPDHTKYRAITRKWFLPANLKILRYQIEKLAHKYLDRICDGGEIEFVDTVALRLPLSVIMLILGIPESEMDTLHRLTGELFAPHDPDTARNEDVAAGSAAAATEFMDYYARLIASRRGKDGNDLVTIIANATIDDAPISDRHALSYCVSITAAGHDTTASSIAGGLHALASTPGEYEKLRNNSDLVNTAVEEIFRYVSPVRNFMRVAIEDVTIRSQRIRAGEAVLNLYPSANRDEDAFKDGNLFKIDREARAHLAFGTGAHACLGMNLARMELQIFYTEFVKRVKEITLLGPVSWTRANFLGGPKSLPVKCDFAI